jgi:putative DNA primase/helicase
VGQRGGDGDGRRRARRAQQNAGGDSAKAQAIAFLRDALADGSKPANEVAALAADAGYSQRTVRRAREALQIKPSKKTGANGEWIWALQDSG